MLQYPFPDANQPATPAQVNEHAILRAGPGTAYDQVSEIAASAGDRRLRYGFADRLRRRTPCGAPCCSTSSRDRTRSPAMSPPSSFVPDEAPLTAP